MFKHVILVQLLKSLARKDKPFAYIETHAGAGRYDLHAPQARKSGEHREGIARLFEAPVPEGLEDYLAAVRAMNPAGELRYYPGSPSIARYCLRPQDRMRLAEQLLEECARLETSFAHDAQVSVRCGDGYAALKGWLPPPERRGAVLIDPPYERVDEWDSVREALTLAVKRWEQGIVAVWYPLKAGGAEKRFKAELVNTGVRNLLVAELSLWPSDNPFRLNGCGMLIYNPPYRFAEELGVILGLLGHRLRREQPETVVIDWLAPE